MILHYEGTAPGRGELVLLDLDSGTRRTVGKSGSRPDHFPSWSPDGSRFAFESYRKGGWHVWVANADGSQARRLTDLPDYNPRHYEFDPSFSNDGRSVVFVQGADLWRVSLDDPSPRRLGPQGQSVWASAPAVSPDGRSIVYVRSDEEDQHYRLFLMNGDGSSHRPLIRDATGNHLAPTWSPDGSRVLFYSDRSGSLELYELAVADESVRAVLDPSTLDAAGFETVPMIDPWDNNWGAIEQYRASYSPDGEWITFSREVDGDRELFAVRRDGTRLERLTRRPGLDAQPSWRPR